MDDRLPEEMAMECLIRVPHQSFADLRRVCRRWKKELDSPLFHRLRSTAGSARSLVILSQAQHAASSAAGPAHKLSPASLPAQRLAVLDPFSGHWDCLPDIPCLPRGIPLFCGLAATACKLAVVGGWDPHTWVASDAVYVYSFLTGAWRRGRPMPGPRRSFFACAGGGGMVFVAGGHDEEKNALRSAMVYDVGRDEWTALPEMATERDECVGVLFDGGGVFRVVGGYCTEMQGKFGRSAEEFDVGEWRWRPVEEATMEAGECPRTCTTVGWDGRMYMCVGAGRVVMAADGEGAWRAVAELPEDARVAPQIVACRRGLVVVGAGKTGSEQAAYILAMRQGKEAAWRRLEVPPQYSGYVQGGCCLEI